MFHQAKIYITIKGLRERLILMKQVAYYRMHSLIEQHQAILRWNLPSPPFRRSICSLNLRVRTNTLHSAVDEWESLSSARQIACADCMVSV